MLAPPQRAYAQFCALPKELRGGVTDKMYAELVTGGSVKTLESWRAKAEFKRAVEEIQQAQKQAGDYEAWCMYQRTVYAAYDNFESLNSRRSKDANIHSQLRQWAKVIQSLTEHAAITKNTVRFDALKDEELAELMLRLDLNAGLDKEAIEKAHKVLTTPRTRRGPLSKDEEI